jgi:hypothetical protein
VIPRRTNLCNGSPYPKARDAASQEGYANVLKLWETSKGVRYDWRNIHAIWRRNGLFPATRDFAGLRPCMVLARPLNQGGRAAESRKHDLILGPALE